MKLLEEEFPSEDSKAGGVPTPPKVRLLGWVVKALITRAYPNDLAWIRKVGAAGGPIVIPPCPMSQLMSLVQFN